MCRVFLSSLGDLELRWFYRLPAGSIRSFHQLTESFIARFVINTKAPKGFDSLLTLTKGKSESLGNYNKCYWETYNEIEECLEELVVTNYKLGLIPGEKIWENSMLSLSVDLQNLMSPVEMFTQLEDDVWQVEQNIGLTLRAKGNSKGKRKARLITRVGQGKGLT